MKKRITLWINLIRVDYPSREEGIAAWREARRQNPQSDITLWEGHTLLADHLSQHVETVDRRMTDSRGKKINPASNHGKHHAMVGAEACTWCKAQKVADTSMKSMREAFASQKEDK